MLKVSSPIIKDKLSSFKRYSDSFHLQPIPLHKRKLKERGFNQSKIISDFFESYFNYPVIDCLSRIKNTAAQAQLKQNNLRFLNVKGAFLFTSPDKKVKEILLIDDVVTTGSTVKEATIVLKKNGVAKVFIFALAKG